MLVHSDEREALLKNYEDQNAPTEDSTETEDADTSTETEDTVTSTETGEQLDAEASTETEDAADPADKEDYESEDSEAETEDDESMVPHGAFHEERERRKELAQEVVTLKEQLNNVLQDYKKLAQAPPEPEEADPYANPEIEALKRQVSDLAEFKRNVEQRQVTTEKQQKDADHVANVNATDQKLEKAGFPGFIYATDAVGMEIRRLIAEDPGNSYLTNPDGWEKVYKEIVYPKLSGKFSKIHKGNLFDQKREKKAKQKLAGKAGAKVTPAPEADDKWEYSDYMEFRRSQSIG